MAFCIPIVLAEKLKAAAQRGEIDIEKMYQMTSEERRTMFQSYVDSETARFINTGFENAMASEQNTSLKKWAIDTFTGGEKAKIKQKDVLNKIEELNKSGLLTPTEEKAFLEDAVAQKLGVAVTPEEAKVISEKATKLEDLYSKLDGLGYHASNPEGQIAYLKARREMENYLESLTPSGNLKILTSTIARGNMLFRLPSILVNINSNNIEGAIGSIVRRFSERTIQADNVGEIGKYIAFNTRVFRETGYDLSRMTSIQSEKKILGEDMVSSQGKGMVRKVARWYEDKIFNLTQGLPDVFMSSAAFADRATLTSTRIARHLGMKGEVAKSKALEIVKDAMMVEPQTKEGQLVREVSRMDAERSTNTDKRMLAEKALAFRKILNVKDFRFGDMNIPFVKTTANAIQSSLETSGITVPVEAIADTIRMVKRVQGGEQWGEASKEAFAGFGSTVVRAGIGILAAYLIANAIRKEDYIGIYPTGQAERELFKLKNATANSIRIGDKYYSLDWFGPIAAPLIGFLNAKKYGYDLPTSTYFFGAGVSYQILKTPGIDYARQSLDSLVKFLTTTKETSVSDVQLQLANYLVDFTKSRFIPGFMQSIAELTDNVVRDTSSKNDILAPIKGIIPGLRETLPEKKTVFGKSIPTEGWGSLIFGGRRKTTQDDKLTRELDRLNESGNLPSITDVSKTSTRMKALREQIGDAKFNQAMQYFGNELQKGFERKISSFTYKRKSDEEKKKALDDIKNDVMDRLLRKYHYKKPKSP